MAQDLAYDRIMHTAIGFWSSKVLLSAVEIGVFGTLAAGPLDAHPCVCGWESISARRGISSIRW
jgi:hypothetical protein